MDPLPPPLADLAALLEAVRRGEAGALDELFAAVYEELRRLARRVRAGRSETLNTTALVHESYLKLCATRRLSIENRVHFYRIAARAMRQVLVEAARRRRSEKRGAGLRPVTLTDAIGAAPLEADEVVALDEALGRLAAFSPRQAQVVECRFFAGLSLEETALALESSEATVSRDWRTARAWLASQLRSSVP
jgi:RNA polymerase sigma factor (TIGR02999 family)